MLTSKTDVKIVHWCHLITVIIIILITTMFMVLLPWHSH